jgi:NUMOD3 motif
MTQQIVVIPASNRLCACGCGALISEFDKQGRPRRFKYGHINKGQNHPLYGKHLTTEHKLRSSQSHKGQVAWNKGGKNPKISCENNYSWKGDSVGYRALHQWVNIQKPKPLDGLCEFCNIKPCEHLACVTYTYTRDFGNWKYLCSKCHNRFDLERAGRLIPKDRKCCKCSSNKTFVDKRGYARWFVLDKFNNLYECRNCHERHKRLSMKTIYSSKNMKLQSVLLL